MYGHDGMIVGMQKRRIEKYKEIVRKLLEKKESTAEEKEFLKKEKVIG
jgi:hypothetical protein